MTGAAIERAPAGQGTRSAAPVLLLATQVFESHGGVQAYMRRLLEVCHSFTETYGCLTLSRGASAPEHLERCRVFASPSKPGYVVEAVCAAVLMRPKLVIAGHIGMAPVAMMLHQLGLARSYAVVLHGIEAWRRCDWIDRLACRRARAVIATTQFTASEFTRHNGTDYRGVVIPLALGERELPPAPKPRVSDRVRILTVARLVSADDYKGIDTLLLAVTELRKRGIAVALDIVGDGDDMPRLDQIARRGGICDRVRFHGSVPDAALEKLYARADIFALPSRSEGFGIVFLEAMRNAKPCIGGNHGGTPEVIDHNVDGLLVEHGDVEMLTGAIAQLAGDAPLRAQFGAAGQRKVAERYLFGSFESNWHRALNTLV